MRRAVSVSLGSSRRDHDTTIELAGTRVRVTRIGTDGDRARARRLFADLDGAVDALGFGGGTLALEFADARYPFRSVAAVVADVHRTPLVDGAALKHCLERRVADVLEAEVGGDLSPRRVLVTVATDRWDMSLSFAAAGYECLFGDFGLALGIPIPFRSPATFVPITKLIAPIACRLPLTWLYPLGVQQETSEPRCRAWFDWATVIAGDFHYIRRHMPARLDRKIVCTNTTTPEDVAMLRAAGVRHLLTTTPVLEGRTFGTNLIEAALVAASGRGRALDTGEIAEWVARTGIAPTLRRLGDE